MADALSRRRLRELGEQEGGDPATLPAFGDGERDLGAPRAVREVLAVADHQPVAGQGVDALSRPVQEQILAKGIEVYAINAGQIARKVGLAGRINIVLQTCFFAISGVLPRDESIAKIKEAIKKTYGRRGAEVVESNWEAVDQALEGLHRIEVPDEVTATRELPPMVPAHAPEFVRAVTAEMMAGRGDDLPVSALPVDGTYPSGTTAYEKRNISELVAVWDSELCIQCGNCSFVCPHSVIRSTYYDPSHLEGAQEGFRSAPLEAGRGLQGEAGALA